MDYKQAVEYFTDENGMRRKAGAYKFFALQIGDTLTITGTDDIASLRNCAAQFAARHGRKLTVEKIGPQAVRVTRIAPNPDAVAWGRKGGRPLGAEALAVDAMEVGATLVLPWRVNAAGERIGQTGMWQMLFRSIQRGEKLGKAFYSCVVHKGAEVKRIK